jgi:hypothetical protein
LLALLASLAGDKSIKGQVGAVVGKVVDADFPDDWPGLVEEVQNYLKGDEGQLEAGLVASVEIFRTFRFVPFAQGWSQD